MVVIAIVDKVGSIVGSSFNVVCETLKHKKCQKNGR